MIKNIPVSESAHARISSVSMWLCIAALVVFTTVLAWSGFNGWRQASAILKDHSVVVAPVKLEDIEEKSGRKGRTTYTYHFSYTFEAGGTTHTGTFSTSESNSERYMEEDATVKVAYANAEPSRFERLDRLEANKSLGSVLKRWLITLVISGVLAFAAHQIITRRLFVVDPPATTASA